MRTSQLLAILIIALGSVASGRKVVCYYQSYASYRGVNPEDFDANLCTHVNYAFVSINSDGSLKASDEYLDVDQGLFYRVTDMKQRNGNLKVLLSIGGASAPSQTFASIAADSGKRAAMVGSARWFLETYHFDGIDLDWEVPGDGDRGNFIALLQDFRNDFDRNGWLVTAAVSANPSGGYDVYQISQILDHVNIMTYDMYGPWSEYTGQNSALWASSVESDWERQNLNMDACVRNWINAGASPSKLVAGIPFYGRTFTLQDPNNNWLHAPITGAGRAGPISGEAGAFFYIEYCQNPGAWSCTWDAEQRMPVCHSGDQWLGYEDGGSIRNKISWINSNNIGGAMIWSIDQDDVKGSCGTSQELLHAIKDNID